MFTIRELRLIRMLIDKSHDRIDNEKFNKISISCLDLRDKVSDLIILQKAWNKGKRIEEERNCF